MTPMSLAEVNRAEIPEIVIVVNGPLGMSAGKMVGQAFQAACRAAVESGATDTFKYWYYAGTRTIVKVAKTPGAFDRIVREVPGYVMRDEGFTEVEEDAPTMFVSYPFLHQDRPKVLDNKKVSLL